jgi:hypothetical protein
VMALLGAAYNRLARDHDRRRLRHRGAAVPGAGPGRGPLVVRGVRGLAAAAAPPPGRVEGGAGCPHRPARTPRSWPRSRPISTYRRRSIGICPSVWRPTSWAGSPPSRSPRATGCRAGTGPRCAWTGWPGWWGEPAAPTSAVQVVVRQAGLPGGDPRTPVRPVVPGAARLARRGAAPRRLDRGPARPRRR